MSGVSDSSSNTDIRDLNVFQQLNRYLLRSRLDLRFDLTEVLSLLIACVAAWFLFSGGGLLNTRGGGDSPFLLQRLHQLEQALADGHFPVRWMPDANYGYGYPFFNFYAPFAFYVAYVFRLLRFSLVEAIQLSQVTAFFVAAWGMYRLTLGWFKQRPVALLASAAYTLAPFHLVNVYVRGDSIAEFWAMAFYPLTFLAVDTLFTRLSHSSTSSLSRPSALSFFPLAFAYAGLVISHNISAMIFSPFIGLYALFRLWTSAQLENRNRSNTSPLRIRAYAYKPIFSLFLALLGGLLLSAWFWLPAIGEQELTQLSEITLGYFDYRYNDGFHFRTVDLVQSTFFFDPEVAGGRAFRMGLVQALLILLALLKVGLFLTQQKKKEEDEYQKEPLQIGRLTLFLIGGLLLATIMLTPLSLPLWDRLPLLSYTQFPWRFLSIQAFFGAALSGFLLYSFTTALSNRNFSPLPSLVLHRNQLYLGVGLLLTLLLFSSLGRIRPDYLPLAADDIDGLALARYEWFTRNIGTTISAEYLATSMTPRPVTSAWVESGDRNRVIITNGDAEAELEQRKTGQERWAIDVESETADLVLPTMFWPGWQAVSNGDDVAIQAAAGSGLVQLTLPQGEHELSLLLTRTPFRLWGERLSLLTLIAIIAYQGVALRQNMGWNARSLLIFIWLPLFGIVTLLLARIFAPAVPDGGLLTWDFGQMGYLHRAEQIEYGHGATLTGYRYSVDAVARCETLEIELDWVNPPPGDVRQVTLELVTPSDNFFKDVPPLVSQNALLAGGTARYRFEIPPDAPTGLFIPNLSLSDRNRPRTATGQKRGFLYLRPIEILPGCSEEAHPFADGAPRDLDLIGLGVTHSPTDPQVLDIDLVWQTTQPQSENLAVSLRLTDRIGREIHAAQRDTQPGFGYRPTGLWPLNEPVYDQLNLILPDEMPFEPPYYLLAKLYDPFTGETRLNRRLGRLDGQPDHLNLVFQPHQPAFDAANLMYESVEIRFGDASGPLIELVGYEMNLTGDPDAQQIELTLVWQALAPLPLDYNHFIHLIDPATGSPVVQHDGLLDNNTFPTSQLVPGEYITDRLVLSLAGLAPGEYPLTTGLYFNDGKDYPRLMLRDADGDFAPLRTVVVE